MDKCPHCGSEDVGCEDDSIFENEDITVETHHMRCNACEHLWLVNEVV